MARSGSVQSAAGEMALSISSVSHHVARLEEQLGVALFDRSSRPFTLTREGQQALRHVSKSLFHLRRATSETAISGMLGARSLSLGVVEDFESNVTPEIAVILARKMPEAELSIRYVLSHEAPALLGKREIDLAIVSQTANHTSEVTSDLLLRDPFVLASPEGYDVDPEIFFSGGVPLPFLRFNPEHLIGGQIDAHLARSRITLPNRFAFDSARSIMAIIASGNGWSIITPLGFMRAQRIAASVRLHPLPLPAFARQLILMSRSDFDAPTRRALAAVLRQIINREVVAPARALHPWLTTSFTVIASDP